MDPLQQPRGKVEICIQSLTVEYVSIERNLESKEIETKGECRCSLVGEPLSSVYEALGLFFGIAEKVRGPEVHLRTQLSWKCYLEEGIMAIFVCFLPPLFLHDL